MYDIKKQLAWSKLKVGTVITIALATLLATVFLAGDIEDMISPKTLLTIDIKDVRGLRKGSPVWFSGLEVGSVKSIDLHPRYGTVVSVSVNRDVLGYLKKDTRATVQTMGLLGDKYIELSSGSPDAQQLQPGDMVEGTTEIGIQDVIETGAESLKKLTAVAEQLGRLVETVGDSEGTVAQLLKDPALYNNLKDASLRISSMSADMQEKKGTLGKLIGDDLLYNKLVSATVSMDTFGKKLNEGSGTLNRLAEDSTLYDRLLKTVTSLEDFSLKLSKGPGTLNRLAEDPGLYENFAQASGHLSAILQRIDRGEGTAGSLIRDEKLAQELKDTIRELRELTSDIRDNPTKYFKFSIF
jgi:phospholipid/cholesterol/gamma-HCH transport system substrate-binding protein